MTALISESVEPRPQLIYIAEYLAFVKRTDPSALSACAELELAVLPFSRDPPISRHEPHLVQRPSSSGWAAHG